MYSEYLQLLIVQAMCRRRGYCIIIVSVVRGDSYYRTISISVSKNWILIISGNDLRTCYTRILVHGCKLIYFKILIKAISISMIYNRHARDMYCFRVGEIFIREKHPSHFYTPLSHKRSIAIIQFIPQV